MMTHSVLSWRDGSDHISSSGEVLNLKLFEGVMVCERVQTFSPVNP